MDLKNKCVLLTGACGGIGRALARALAQRGANLCLVDRRTDDLETLAAELRSEGVRIETACADITTVEGRDGIVRCVHQRLEGIDVLLNNAGIGAFAEFVEQSPGDIEQMFKVNVVAPMQLTRELLPTMIEKGGGRIVNIGSVFGSIAFAWHTSYSASKFALRGFSEALRRELVGTGVGVSYIAPRAVKTTLNSTAVYRMAKEVNMKMDEPADVARRVVQAIERDRDEVVLGWPESLFVRLNSLFPRLIDVALRKQNRIMRTFLHEP